MIICELESPRWSRRRWAYSVGLLFLTQVGLVFWLGRRSEPIPERPIFRTSILLAADERSGAQIAALLDREDPALLALPSSRGFSGTAWLQTQPPNEEPADEPDPPAWLGLAESSLGASFASFVASNVITPLLVADKPLPRLPRSEPGLPPEPVASRSRCSVEGDLAARILLSPPELPSWPGSDILSNSVVQVVVNGDGFAVFTALLAQSGSKDADARALELAAGVRFRPLPRQTPEEPLTWGRLVFRWHTLPLPLGEPPAISP